jgi:hypothetical protein
MNAPSKKPQAAETVEQVLDKMDAQRAANLRIWNAVCKTDPAHTKPVEFGRKFTAIDAHYQIQEATRMFGPVGEGWGYDTGEIMFEDGLVIVPVTLWHGSREKSFGPIYGSTTIRDRKGNIDKDAPKKATTDALTKALSQLGFNADVFLGKFDDNKYVEEVRKEFHPPANPQTGEPKPRERVKLDGPYTCPTQLRTAAREFVRTLEGLGDLDEFIAWSETDDFREFCTQLERDMPDWWQGGPSVPADFVPLEMRIRQKRDDLERAEGVRAKENA